MANTLPAPRSSRINYLAEYDAAGDAQKFPLVRRWLDSEPLPFFQQLREKRPVLVTPACTLVTTLTDVTEVLEQPTIFTVELYKPKMKDFLMTHDADPLHTREKSIMRGFLNRDDLPAVRNMVATISQTLLDAAAGRLEAIDGYCRMVPARLVQEYFGLDGKDPKDLIRWSYWNQYDTFHNYSFDLISAELSSHISAEHDAANQQLVTYISELIARKLVQVKAQEVESIFLWPVRLVQKLWRMLRGEKVLPLRDDIVTRMLRTSYPAAVDFDIQRLGLNAGGLLIGAVETTSQAVSQTLQFLLDRKDLLASAVAAARKADTAEFDGIVWEALRFVPISPFLFRKTSQPCTVGKNTSHETTIPAGTIVLAVTQSAMFDPAAFENPDQFIPGRNWYGHFHFGFGTHECLGKYVGMVMIPEMVRQILLRPGIKALGPIDFKSGPLPESYQLSWSANS
jgi:cytochrome P450